MNNAMVSEVIQKTVRTILRRESNNKGQLLVQKHKRIFK
jgi:hypothetical protein